MKKYKVKYQIASYSGEVTVSADENADREEIIAKAKKKLRDATGSLPFGSESFKIEEE
jgi:hypothetical protein